jgi:hypothetical protein
MQNNKKDLQIWLFDYLSADFEISTQPFDPEHHLPKKNLT